MATELERFLEKFPLQSKEASPVLSSDNPSSCPLNKLTSPHKRRLYSSSSSEDEVSQSSSLSWENSIKSLGKSIAKHSCNKRRLVSQKAGNSTGVNKLEAFFDKYSKYLPGASREEVDEGKENSLEPSIKPIDPVRKIQKQTTLVQYFSKVKNCPNNSEEKNPNKADQLCEFNGQSTKLTKWTSNHSDDFIITRKCSHSKELSSNNLLDIIEPEEALQEKRKDKYKTIFPTFKGSDYFKLHPSNCSSSLSDDCFKQRKNHLFPLKRLSSGSCRSRHKVVDRITNSKCQKTRQSLIGDKKQNNWFKPSSSGEWLINKRTHRKSKWKQLSESAYLNVRKRPESREKDWWKPPGRMETQGNNLERESQCVQSEPIISGEKQRNLMSSEGFHESYESPSYILNKNLSIEKKTAVESTCYETRLPKCGDKKDENSTSLNKSHSWVFNIERFTQEILPYCLSNEENSKTNTENVHATTTCVEVNTPINKHYESVIYPAESEEANNASMDQSNFLPEPDQGDAGLQISSEPIENDSEQIQGSDIPLALSYFPILGPEANRSVTTETSTQTDILGVQCKGSRQALSENCILYGDNLLNELLREKPNILKMYNKNQRKRRSSVESNGVLAKTCVKRYKKGKTRIFKVKRRLKSRPQEPYVPPEDQIMIKFTQQLSKNFQDDSSSEADDGESVKTPSSYQTVADLDETTSEVLSTGSGVLKDSQKILRRGINKLFKDATLLFSSFCDSAPKDFDAPTVLMRVHEHILRILEDFEQGKELFFKYPSAAPDNVVFRNGRYQLKENPTYTTTKGQLRFRNVRFNLLLFVLNKVRLLLESGTKLTKRELFYQMKPTISTQYSSNVCINAVSRMLNVGTWALNITAQKGLVYGNLTLVMKDGATINCNVAGTSVPLDPTEICEIQSDAYFILVVEKESIFHKLLEENLPSRLTRPFILITGKGFPDLATQLFLKKLWMVMTVPVFILVDADPAGIAIMLNYRFGSVANAHVSEYLAIPKAKWLGVFPSEIQQLKLVNAPLSRRDAHNVERLLRLQSVQQNERIKKQLEILQESGVKTGIEGVMKSDTYLSNRYLSAKFYMNDLI